MAFFAVYKLLDSPMSLPILHLSAVLSIGACSVTAQTLEDARKDAKTTFEKWKGHPTGGGNYSSIPTKDVEVLPREPGSCLFCGADKSYLTHRQEAWSDQTECSRCGGSSGYAIGD